MLFTDTAFSAPSHRSETYSEVDPPMGRETSRGDVAADGNVQPKGERKEDG